MFGKLFFLPLLAPAPAANNSDSAPAIREAFARCGHNPDDAGARGQVVFKGETYHIQSVLNTTGLRNVDVDLRGTLLWDQNIPYWLNHSLPVGYQNQSSAWLFGGDNVRWNGHGYGTLDGNGQVWYDFVNGTNNYPGRPHQITVTGSRDSVFQGIRFVQSQMWTVTVIHSENILMEDIYVNSTDTKQEVGFDFSSLNTDGADTVYANNITFRRWVVDNGDDSIALKANSTNILIEDCRFHTGLGVAIGSIGQYPGAYETIENVTARNIQILDRMRYGVYNFTLEGATGIFAVTQCTSYNDATGGCDTSQFHIRDLVLDDWHGTAVSDVVAAVQCSAARPCTGIEIKDIDIVDTVNGTAPASYLCDNVDGPKGFACTGPTWEENNR
ncbi:pectin lyase-like protein [Apiospora rasikravindrae]|uniref:Pectin lyase-like protein n=1 Tax=Apiospora rasikravindrae TaxID=990691 RepID=A0ABR1TDQ8_9PEZI